MFLLLAASGCTGADPSPTDLRSHFPEHVNRVTDTGRTFDTVGGSYVLMPEHATWGPSRLEVRLPKSAREPVRMRLDAINVEFDIYELDLKDDARRDGDAVTYGRKGGMSW